MKTNLSCTTRKYRVIASNADIFAWMDLRPALTNNNLTAAYTLTVIELYAKALTSTITTV